MSLPAVLTLSGFITGNGSSRSQRLIGGGGGVGGQWCHLVSMLRVLVVLVVSRVVGGQWWPVYARVIKRTVTLISAASLHHEVATHRPLGHVCQQETQ